VGFSNTAGLYFSRLKPHTKGLLRFPDSKSDKVISEIDKFWNRRHYFKNRAPRPDIFYKRGILLHGPPGAGKTCTVAMILEDVINRGGIGLNFTEPDLLLRECEFLEKFRSRQRS